jgi:hypothetical protein
MGAFSKTVFGNSFGLQLGPSQHVWNRVRKNMRKTVLGKSQTCSGLGKNLGFD